MANEWVKVELLGPNRDGEPRSLTVASGTAITKGTVLTLTDERTGLADLDTSNAMVAGIAAADKSGTDFSTEVSAWTQGIFIATQSGAPALAIGATYAIWGNKVTTPNVTTGVVGASHPGYALSAIADGTTGQVRLNL